MFISMLATNFEYYFAYQKWQRRNFSQHDDFDEKQGLCQGKIMPITFSLQCAFKKNQLLLGHPVQCDKNAWGIFWKISIEWDCIFRRMNLLKLFKIG